MRPPHLTARPLAHRLGLLLGCVSLLALAACQREPAAETAHSPLCLNDSLRRLVRIDIVRYQPRQQELHLTGKITFDQDRLAQVFATLGGQVQRVYVSLGDRVLRSQPLATLYSADMAALAQQASAARADLAVAEKQLETTKDLYEGGLASKRDFTVAQQTVAKAKAELDRTEETLRLFGSRTAATYTLTAPADGFVVEKNISEGSVLPSGLGQDAFSIAPLNEVWVVANVYESDLALIRQGLAVTVSTLAYPDRKMAARIDKVSNVLDPQSKVASVRIRLPNTDLRLKPEMFADVRVIVGRPDAPLEPTVPADAIVFDGGSYYLVAAPGVCELKVVPVQIANVVGPLAYLSTPVPKGLPIVAQNQLLVYTELTSR